MITATHRISRILSLSEKHLASYTSDKSVMKERSKIHPQLEYIINHKEEPREMIEEEKTLEIQTKSGYKIIIYANPLSLGEIIKIQKYDAEHIPPLIEFDTAKQSILISTKKNLSIKADNIEIESKETMKLKSGSTMTINGSLVKIN